jgi:uncharacterized membrane protein
MAIPVPDSYLLTKYLHVLAFAYWLGADLGVFYAARLAARADLGTAERRRALRLALLLDMGPRTALILVLPTGLTLTVLGGWVEADGRLILAVWIAAAAWLALAWWLFLAGDRPARTAALWRGLDLGVRAIVVAGAALFAASSLTGHGPLQANWLALKLLLYAAAVAIGVILRFLLADWFRGMSLVSAGGTGVASGNALVARASRRAEAWALLLWFLVAAIALLGVAQPRIA